jgi:L-ascorbate metabolism protein UlaG (beta-lactamase superfamily)
MRRSLRTAILASCCLVAFYGAPAALAADRLSAAKSPKPSARRGLLSFTYLGNAGWRIEDGRTVILVDPCVSQFHNGGKDIPRHDDDIVQPDEALIAQHIPRADAVLVTHSHADHMVDAPVVARRTGAFILGSADSASLARANGLPDSQLIVVRGGEDLEFGAFSVRVLPSLHSELLHKHYNSTPLAGPVPPNLTAPLTLAAYREGQTFAYLLRLSGHRILIMGGMNYIEREMQGLNADIALVGAGASHREVYRYAPRLMQALGRPRWVFPTHWDSYGTDPPEVAHRRAEAFAREIRAASPGTRVIIPAYFTPVPVS